MIIPVEGNQCLNEAFFSEAWWDTLRMHLPIMWVEEERTFGLGHWVGYSFPGAAVNRGPQLVALNNRILFSHGVRGWKLKTEGLAVLLPAEDSEGESVPCHLLACGDCCHLWCALSCRHITLVSACLCPLTRMPAILHYTPTLFFYGLILNLLAMTINFIY